MDPIELLDLCALGARKGAPPDIVVPAVFGLGDFEAAWRRDPVRVRGAFDEVLCAAHPGVGLELLLRSGALHALVPELSAIKDLGDDPVAALHKDVWDHTKRVVEGVPATLELRWSALMHDVGKARTRRVGPHGTVTFHNHDVVGAKIVDGIERRLGLFRSDTTLHVTVRTMVLNHLRPAGYKATWTDSGVRRLLADMGGMRGFERLMALSRADLTTKNAAKRDRALSRGRELEDRVKRVHAVDGAPRLPKGAMGALIAAAAAPPGPWVNAARRRLEDAMASGALPAGEGVDFYVAEGLRLVQEVARG